MENLKENTVKGVAWSAVDRVANGGIQFLANVMLARILSPDDFGLIAVIAIFIQISQVFIDSGFSNALIQKKDRTQTDYSTVFLFNLGISCLLYAVLFFCAPLIAAFFKNDTLTALTRVVGLNLLIGALVSVHKTRLSIELRFKIQAFVTLISSLVSAAAAIALGYAGWGVWSLVILTLLNTALQVTLIYVLVHWMPSLTFSVRAFRHLFSYSSKLLGASMIALLYRNVYSIIIGKKYSITDLGFFNTADNYAMYPSALITTVVTRVAFPIFSRIQDDDERLRRAFSKYIVFASMVMFPIMITLMALAEPLTLLVLKEKWLPFVPLLQILCLDWMTDHICNINLNILYVKGRSDLALKLEIIKKSIAMGIFFVSLFWGITGVCVGRVIYSYCAVYIQSFYTKRLIGISLGQQLKDVAVPLLQAAAAGTAMWLVTQLGFALLPKVCLALLAGILFYIVIVRTTTKNNYFELKEMIGISLRTLTKRK